MMSTTSEKRTVFFRIISAFLIITVMLSLFELPVSAATPKLSSSTLTVAVGETRTIQLKNATGTVKWSTSDKSVATVSKGKVTGKKSGTVTISAKYKSKTYKCKVTVKPYRIYAKTSKMDVGDTQTLKVKGKTENVKIKWSTSDKSVLTVTSKGKVTAKKAGSATIYAKIGNKKYGKKIYVNPDIRDTGKALNIYLWNTEFQEAFEKYYNTEENKYMIGDVTINFIINPAEGNIYNQKVDESLLGLNKTMTADIFLFEEEDADKYLASPLVVPLDELGITDSDTKNMYKFTKDICTYDGKLKAAAWQVCPGGFVYRRSIAKKVLGTDNPAKVQEYLSSWSGFESVAKKMKSKGYYMVSNTDTMAKPFFYNEADRFVSGNELKMNGNMRDWLAISKRFYDKGYCSGSQTWSAAWCDEQTENSNVFGFFYSTWGVNFTLPNMSIDYYSGETDGSYGDWAIVEGPENFSWGGSYIAVAHNSDNKALAADVIRKLCCDTSTMKKMALGEEKIYPNNSAVLDYMAKKNIKDDFMGGQNTYAVFADAAKGCRAKGGISIYDGFLFFYNLDVFDDYFNGYASYKDAMQSYYQLMSDAFPELYTPSKIPSEPR